MECKDCLRNLICVYNNKAKREYIMYYNNLKEKDKKTIKIFFNDRPICEKRNE